MAYSRNWTFTFSGDDELAILMNKTKDNIVLDKITFLQLSQNKCLVVFKNQVRKSAVRKLFSATDAKSLPSPKEFRDSMGEVAFSYGKLLNKYEKKLANKSTNYCKIVQDFSKTALVPEDDPKFDIVYDIIASADTIEEGMLKIYEDLPLCKHLIYAALKRFRLKKTQTYNTNSRAEAEAIIWRPWQQELLKEIEASPDPRKIIWYYDSVGNNGKSFFAKWRYQLDQSTVVLQSGKSKDIYHIIAKHAHDIKTVIFDFTRSAENGINYNVIESIKNGYFQSGKYDSQFICIPTPHIVVFANFNANFMKLSTDRWDIRQLSESKPTSRHWLPTTTLNVYKASMCLSHKTLFCRNYTCSLPKCQD